MVLLVRLGSIPAGRMQTLSPPLALSIDLIVAKKMNRSKPDYFMKRIEVFYRQSNPMRSIKVVYASDIIDKTNKNHR